MLKLLLLLCFVVSSPVWISVAQAGHSRDLCHPWSFYNDTLQECQCYKGPTLTNYDNVHLDFALQCPEKMVLMNVLFCMTNEKEVTFLANCYTYSLKQNATVVDRVYIKLPHNISELNNFMCRRMNRKGRVCSECVDGFAPSMTSIGSKCSNCTSIWYGVPLYL